MNSQQEVESGGTSGDIMSLDDQQRPWLVCPECAAALQQSAGQLHCTGCLRTWPIIDGVPHFIKDFPYWGEIPQEKMQEVNRLAGTGSWRRTLLDSPDASVQQASQMILNLDRANWHWLLNLPLQSRVLDLGAGTGTNSHALALRYHQVIAVEPVLERIQFMQQRFAQERLANVKILRSSLWALPCAKESFDLVVMNGVLEWVAAGRAGDPGAVQQEALRKVASLLRPGGYLYLGIENRLCSGSFMGYPDPHCGLPHVTILPRPLAQWYARRKGADGYRNYLYSSRGYRKLLQKTGFSNMEFYVAVPSYNHPRFLIPLKGDVFSHYARISSSLRTELRRHGWKKKLRKLAHDILLNLKILKYFESSFVILARK